MHPEKPMENFQPGPPPLAPELAGKCTIFPDGPVEAGSWQSFTLTYTAGPYGMDDTASLKVVFRFASDQTMPQTQDPKAPGYLTAEAANGATLSCRFDYKQNTRPWDRTIHVKVVKGCMAEGDTIVIRLGDRRFGSPGMRMQTFADPAYEFRVLADPIACYHFARLSHEPTIAVLAGPRVRVQAVLPTLRRVGEPFRLCLRAEDAWGNPSPKDRTEFALAANLPVQGLPEHVVLEDGQSAMVVQGLSCETAGDLVISLYSLDIQGQASSNPCRLQSEPCQVLPYWADLHGQSAETIGTGTAEAYFAFARDQAFLDAAGHQGNDFQVTKEFWDRLGRACQAYNQTGGFVVLPGYEWSGNTPLGGDRNVYFLKDDRPIRRSSHALVPDHWDLDSDCRTAGELFAALAKDNEQALVVAHCGGRYANLAAAHDPRFECAVEIHSSWGTFEWLAHDAFDLGLRVGIVAGSDDHKARPGASWPGASMFGALGGLTCLMLPELSREAVFDCLGHRRCYATTGSRLHLDVRADLTPPAVRFARDPALGRCPVEPVSLARMGDIIHGPKDSISLRVQAATPAPVERVDFFNGKDLAATWRPYSQEDLGRRIRVVWSGAEYRGRFRMSVWDGSATLEGNAFTGFSPINFFNLDKKLLADGDRRLTWQSVTTGNFAGFDAMLAEPLAGCLKVETPSGRLDVDLYRIGLQGQGVDLGGLDKRLEVYRLPDANACTSLDIVQDIALRANGDNPIYVRVTTEDGHRAWSSPIYVIAEPRW